jgi:hypothetical protein
MGAVSNTAGEASVERTLNNQLCVGLFVDLGNSVTSNFSCNTNGFDVEYGTSWTAMFYKSGPSSIDPCCAAVVQCSFFCESLDCVVHYLRGESFSGKTVA